MAGHARLIARSHSNGYPIQQGHRLYSDHPGVLVSPAQVRVRATFTHLSSEQRYAYFFAEGCLIASIRATMSKAFGREGFLQERAKVISIAMRMGRYEEDGYVAGGDYMRCKVEAVQARHDKVRYQQLKPRHLGQHHERLESTVRFHDIVPSAPKHTELVVDVEWDSPEWTSFNPLLVRRWILPKLFPRIDCYNVILPYIVSSTSLASRFAAGQTRMGTEARSYTVLVVEDDAGVRNITARMLAEAGYKVWEAADGREALGVLAIYGPADVVVTDIRMPRMDGYELATLLRHDFPHLPILFMSGFDLHLSSPSLVGPVLPKPFRMDQLKDMLARLLEQPRRTA